LGKARILPYQTDELFHSPRELSLIPESSVAALVVEIESQQELADLRSVLLKRNAKLVGQVG
jgi:hypothetical protein